MVAFDRFLARLATKEPEAWIVKGGFALQLRLGERARTTKDIDVSATNRWTQVETLAHLQGQHPLISATGSSSKSASPQKQQQERLGADFVFQFAACSMAASSRISTWMWDMAILFLSRLKRSLRQTCWGLLRSLQLGFAAIR
jgi:hypothetical protein